jgi:protein-disulfide isomerase
MKKEVRTLLGIGIVIVIVGVIGAALYRQSANDAPAPKTPEIAEALVRDDSPTLGPADAKVTVVEFLDPECEACAAFAPMVKDILKEFDGQVRFVVRYMPFHGNARLAASYMEAAGEQGKYWEMQEKMFANQSEWGEIHGAPQPADRPDPKVLFEKWGGELGLNVDQLRASAAEKKHLDKIERDFADGRSLGVRRTPTIFVNGKELYRLNPNDLRSMIAAELKK